MVGIDNVSLSFAISVSNNNFYDSLHRFHSILYINSNMQFSPFHTSFNIHTLPFYYKFSFFAEITCLISHSHTFLSIHYHENQIEAYQRMNGISLLLFHQTFRTQNRNRKCIDIFSLFFQFFSFSFLHSESLENSLPFTLSSIQRRSRASYISICCVGVCDGDC